MGRSPKSSPSSLHTTAAYGRVVATPAGRVLTGATESAESMSTHSSERTMRYPVRSGLQVLRRAHDFLTTVDASAAHGPITQHVATLRQIVGRLEAHSVAQEDATRAYRGNTATAHQLVATLRVELMRPVARAAKAFAIDEPALAGDLTMSRARDYERLLAAAYAMAQRAEGHKERFAAAGFSADFADRLRQGGDALRTVLDERNVNFGHRSAATAGMDQELARGRALLLMLRDMVTPRLRGHSARLAEWETLARFSITSRTKRAVVPDVDQPPVTATISPPEFASANLTTDVLPKAA